MRAANQMPIVVGRWSVHKVHTQMHDYTKERAKKRAKKLCEFEKRNKRMHLQQVACIIH